MNIQCQKIKYIIKPYNKIDNININYKPIRKLKNSLKNNIVFSDLFVN